jgi:hypothetical protein
MSTATTQIIISGKDQLSSVVADAGRRMGTEMEGMRRQVLTVNTALAGFAGYFTGGALAAGGSELLRVAASFEKMEVSLQTITGSAAAAEQAMSWITDFTATTPFQLEEVANGFRKLTAYGMDAVEVMPLLGDTAAAMGKSLDQAVEMFADAATGEFERLKEFGVRAKQEGDKVTFSWQENGQQMVATSAKTQEGITNALGGVFDRFEGSMIAQSKTWEGMTSNMADQWTLWKKEVMDSGPFEFLKESMSDFTETFQTETGKMQLKEWAHGTSEAILSTFETASYAVEALAFPINGIKGAFNALKLGIVEIEELALDMYMGLYDFLPSSVSLTSNQIRAMRETIAQTRAEATAGMDAVGENTKFINNMFIELRKNIDKARTESAKVTPGAASKVFGDPTSPSSGGTSSSGAAKESKAREKAYEKMITDGKKAAETLDKYWDDYESRRVSAIVDGTAARVSAVAVERDAIDELTTWGAYSAQAMEDTVSTAFQGMGDAIVDFAMTGKMEFSDFADSIIRDMMRIVVQQQIVGPLASGAGDFLSGLFSGPSSAAGTAGVAGTLSSLMSRSAKGNVFSGPGISAFSNSIVTQPTQFWAKGGHLMGEAGPEAIMPLKRGPDGVLGVSGGGGNFVVNIIESPGNGGKTQSRQENGVNILDVMVEQIKSSIASDINRGSGVVPQAITKSYGLSRAPGAY